MTAHNWFWRHVTVLLPLSAVPGTPAAGTSGRWHIRPLALDVDRLDIAEQATLDEIRVAARPHVPGMAELVGVCELC